jgi:hypothetical protein
VLLVLAPSLVCLGLSACAASTSPRLQTPGSSSPAPTETAPTTAGTTPTPIKTMPTTPAHTTTASRQAMPIPSPSASSTPAATLTASEAILAASNSSSSCTGEQQWGTGPVVGDAAMSPAALYLTQVGEHSCYDSVVFDLIGPQPVGYSARYLPVVLADPSGKPVPVAGGAVLQVTVRAPILGTDDQGHQP